MSTMIDVPLRTRRQATSGSRDRRETIEHSVWTRQCTRSKHLIMTDRSCISFGPDGFILSDELKIGVRR